MCSIELWFRYLAFLLRCALHLQSPLKIPELELLGRALFSGHVKIKTSGAKIFPNAFLINLKSESGISVNRISLAPLRLFRAIGQKSAQARSLKQRRVDNFYGFAEFEGGVPSKIKLEDGFALLPIGVPSIVNPYHADIPLPPDRKKDYYLLIATEMVRHSRFVP